MMKHLTRDNAQRVLCELIARDTINPMGGPFDRDTPTERPVVEYLHELFKPYDVHVERQTYSDAHENLVVGIPGRRHGSAVLFESHMDTVPANDWGERALVPRVENDVVYGRGACDDKGSLASMVLAALELIESGQTPSNRIVLLATGDEEYAATGIKHYMRTTDERFCFGVFGEPTDNVPVVQTKGAIRWDITTHGRAAHTSLRETGRCAIEDMIRVIAAIGEYEKRMQQAHTNPLLTGPRINVTRIDGGRTRNSVADQCTIWVDYRIMPGLTGADERRKLIEYLDTLGLQIAHAAPHSDGPPMSTSPDDPKVCVVLQACEQEIDLPPRARPLKPRGVPYGSNANWFTPGVPAVVLGPGCIDHAHAADEHIRISDVLAGANIHLRLLRHDWQSSDSSGQ